MASVEFGDPQPPDTGKQSTYSPWAHHKYSPGVLRADTGEPKPSDPPKGAKQPTGSEDNARNPLIPEHTPRVSVGDDDYTRKYPSDEYGAEMYPNARIWRTFIDERDIADKEYIEDNNATLDGILVFASIFSAILTTLVTQTYQALQQDPQETSLSLLAELVALQRVIANGSSINDVPSSESSTTPFVPSSSDIWINSLWFISLTLSLLTAFLGVLAKQWLYQYMAVTSGDARSRALVRQARYVGLHDWQVPELIGILPVILHLSLGLFFAGLIVLLRRILQNLAVFVTAVVGSVFVAYIISNILPIIYPRCPYRTALTPKLFKLSNWLYALRSVRLSFLPPSDYQPSSPRSNEKNSNALKLWFEKQCSRLPTLKISASKLPLKGGLWRDAECKDALNSNRVLEAKAVAWLYTASYNPTAKQVVLEALAGSPIDFCDQYAKIWNSDTKQLVEADLRQVCTRLCSAASSADVDRQLELYVRALTKIRPSLAAPTGLYRVWENRKSRSGRLWATLDTFFHYSSTFLEEFLPSEAGAKIWLTTDIWMSLFQTRSPGFELKKVSKILTVLRDVNFFGSPQFSNGAPSTDVHHPTEDMCNAMYTHICREFLPDSGRSNHLDRSQGISPYPLLRLLLAVVHSPEERRTPTSHYSPSIRETIKDIFEALDVTLSCILQIVAKEKGQGTATIWSDSHQNDLVMLTTAPLFKIEVTRLVDIPLPVKRRVLLKTLSLIALVCTPVDPFLARAATFRSAMMKVLLRVLIDSKQDNEVQAWPGYRSADSLALLSFSYNWLNEFVHEATSIMGAIPILCSMCDPSRAFLGQNPSGGPQGDLTFRAHVNEHLVGLGIYTVPWTPSVFLERYLVDIPTSQERALGNPSQLLTSSFNEQIEYLHQPDILYRLYSTLLLSDQPRMLIRLLKLKPDAHSWIDCIKRLIRLPQSEPSRLWFTTAMEESIKELYCNIADIQVILSIDGAKLEDPVWNLTMNSNALKTSRYFKSFLQKYRESESSPEVNPMISSNVASVDSEAPPMRKLHWHERLRRLNPFHRPRAADTSSYDLDEIVLGPASALSDIPRFGNNQSSLAAENEASASAGVLNEQDADTHPQQTSSRSGGQTWALQESGHFDTIEEEGSYREIKKVEEDHGNNEENKLENVDNANKLFSYRSAEAFTSTQDGAKYDQEPSSQTGLAETIYETSEVGAHNSEGPSNSDKALDSEELEKVTAPREKKEIVNNVSPQQKTPGPVVPLNESGGQ